MPKGRRQEVGFTKPYLTLTEAVTMGVILPGAAVRVAVGDPDPEGRLAPIDSGIYEGRIDSFDMLDSTITVYCSACPEPRIDDPVKIAVGVSSGLYVSAGSVTEVSTTPQGAVLLTAWFSGLHWIEDREYVRVHIPGSRATCRTEDRVLDCPVANISARGMLIEGTGELAPGTEMNIRLTIPLFQTADLRGRVVWNEAPAGGPSRAGVKFTHISPHFQARLGNLCMLYHALFSSESPE